MRGGSTTCMATSSTGLRTATTTASKRCRLTARPQPRHRPVAVWFVAVHGTWLQTCSARPTAAATPPTPSTSTSASVSRGRLPVEWRALRNTGERNFPPVILDRRAPSCRRRASIEQARSRVGDPAKEVAEGVDMNFVCFARVFCWVPDARSPGSVSGVTSVWDDESKFVLAGIIPPWLNTVRRPRPTSGKLRRDVSTARFRTALRRATSLRRALARRARGALGRLHHSLRAGGAGPDLIFNI